MLIETAVRKVESGNVHPGVDEAFQHFRRVGRWADRSNDFGFMIGQYHQTPLPESVLAQGSTERRAKSTAETLKSAGSHLLCIVSFLAVRMNRRPAIRQCLSDRRRTSRAS
jgi:hypothetical protein